MSEVKVVKNEEEKWEPSQDSSGLNEKAKGGLPDGALALFNRLGSATRQGTEEIRRSLWIQANPEGSKSGRFST